MTNWLTVYRVNEAGNGIIKGEASRTEYNVTVRNQDGSRSRRFNLHWFDGVYADTPEGAIAKRIAEDEAAVKTCRQDLSDAEARLAKARRLATQKWLR